MIIDQDAQRVVAEQRLGFVATVRPDGTPNLSPKGTLAVWDDEHLVFANIRSPQTIENLASHPSVEVNVVDPLVRKGWRFRGKAEVLREGGLHDDIVAFYGREWGLAPDRIDGVVLIEVNQARPLISPGYDDGTTEAEMVAEWRARWDEIRPS